MKTVVVLESVGDAAAVFTAATVFGSCRSPPYKEKCITLKAFKEWVEK